MKTSIRFLNVGASALLILGLTTLSIGIRQPAEETRSLDSIRGLSKYRTIFGTQSCSERNTEIINNPNLPNPPGVPEGGVSVEDCGTSAVRCYECSGNASEFVVGDGQIPGYPGGYLDPSSSACGTLNFGWCTPLPEGGFTCDDNGSSEGTCANVTEMHNQTPLPGDPS